MYCIENDLKSMDVKTRRKKPEGRSVLVIILNETLIKHYEDRMPMKIKKMHYARRT